MKKTSFMGPSHVLRLRDYITSGFFPVFDDLILYGFNGVPIWDKNYLTQIENAYKESERIVLMIGDFRFGNKVIPSISNTDETWTSINYFGIDSKYISNKNDLLLHENSCRILDYIIDKYGDKVCFIFWDVFFRECFNNEKNISSELNSKSDKNSSGYEYLVAKYAENTIRIDELKLNFRNYIFDSSAHPTQIGYNFLLEKSLKPIRDLVVHVSSREKFELYYSLVGKCTQLFQSGDMNGFMLLSEKLIHTGNFPASLTIKYIKTLIDFERYAEAIGCYKFYSNFVKIDDLGSALLKSLIGYSLYKVGDYILAEELLDESLCINQDQPRALYYASNVALKMGYFKKALFLLGKSLSLNKDAKTAQEYKQLETRLKLLDRLSDNDKANIVIGLDYELFFVGGSHKVKDYVSGRKKININSIKLFESNILNRKKACHDKYYCHVIFPDKQSILKHEYPLENNISLGQYYIDHLENKLTKHLILFYYDEGVKDHLSGKKIFLKNDTHLSNYGYILIFNKILADFDKDLLEDFSDFLKKNVRLKKIRYAGDLGIKFNPPIFQYKDDYSFEGLEAEIHDNNVEGNDGYSCFLSNKYSLSSKTVVIFGDSHFRLMLPIFSIVFEKVIFFRTRFFHSEALSLLRNVDMVLTGNAERYLSHVDSDSNSNYFFGDDLDNPTLDNSLYIKKIEKYFN